MFKFEVLEIIINTISNDFINKPFNELLYLVSYFKITTCASGKLYNISLLLQ